MSLFGFSALASDQTQQADPEFDARVDQPAYATDGPTIVFDEAHNNFHTPELRYRPLADLLKNDGYKIESNREPFTKESLARHKILVIANAMGSDQKHHPAFTDAENDVVYEWIQNGGALLLIADHFPMGHAAHALAKRLGVDLSRGMTTDYTLTAENGLNVSHPIMKGRSDKETIHTVRTFTGEALQGPTGNGWLLRTPVGSTELIPDFADPENRKKDKRVPSMHPDQGAAFKLGKGRVVVLGEAGIFTAQVVNGKQFGMNVPATDNKQFALNVMHWLSGLLPEE